MSQRDPLEPVFRALADATRREILDALVVRDGQSVGELCERFAGRMGRFGVMKHLGVLEEADLVVRLREGRIKRLFLNPVPIEQVANRWISKYAARFTAALVGLDQRVGTDESAPDPSASGHSSPVVPVRKDA